MNINIHIHIHILITPTSIINTSTSISTHIWISFLCFTSAFKCFCFFVFLIGAGASIVFFFAILCSPIWRLISKVRFFGIFDSWNWLAWMPTHTWNYARDPAHDAADDDCVRSDWHGCQHTHGIMHVIPRTMLQMMTVSAAIGMDTNAQTNTGTKPRALLFMIEGAVMSNEHILAIAIPLIHPFTPPFKTALFSLETETLLFICV